MARTRAQSAAQVGRVASIPKDSGRRPRGIQKPRSNRDERRTQQRLVADDTAYDLPQPHPTTKPQSRNVSAPNNRGVKRLLDTRNDDQDRVNKRLRRSSESPPVAGLDKPVPRHSDIDESVNPIAFWAREGDWPREYFARMDRILPRKKSLLSLNRNRSISASSGTPSDQRPREEKSAPYRDPRYTTLLETKGSFMNDSVLGITEQSKDTCYDLLTSAQAVQDGSLFRDDLFKETCRRVQDRNENRVIRDLTPLIVPSAEILYIHGAKHLDILIETVNAGWNNSIPLTGTRPQPDYSVGFKREAFNKEQLEKLSPFIGDFLFGDKTVFMATYYMYFPFLTCEVKCGAGALDVADRQNAHSMTLAVRGVAELFLAVNREAEVHRQVLAFSISHDDRFVRIYGHYPVIDGKDIRYYRYEIRSFSLQELDGREKWTAYQFTKNVYDKWMPSHFEKICSAIDHLPSDVNFDDPSLPATELSQGLESHHPSQHGSGSRSAQDADRSSADKQETITASTSFTGRGAAKRSKRRSEKARPQNEQVRSDSY